MPLSRITLVDMVLDRVEVDSGFESSRFFTSIKTATAK